MLGRKNFKLSVLFVFTLIAVLSITTAGIQAFGSESAMETEDMTLENMLNYAIEDEYLARAEYELIMEEYDIERPFSNIKRAEERHIEILKPLFEEYGFEIPEDVASEYVIIPDSLEEIFEIGIQAEIDNIAMYEKFLETDLPEDVERVFIYLRDGSINHLEAFERGAERGPVGREANSDKRSSNRNRSGKQNN